jgi:LAO/AO transport system kinase
MTDRAITNRRALSRLLTRISNASVAEAMRGLEAETSAPTARIGITGAPGAGKSSLIARLARHRLAQDKRIGVLAIDPTSPVTKGSLLGDRIRMDAVADHPAFFIRSVPSRNAHDGLSDNTPDLLLAMEAHGFDEVVLETVGVGQAEYAVKTLVDTVVLVLMPGSGDAIQAMKAGILETADIYVVNKADLPGAGHAAGEVKATLALKTLRPGAWRHPVLLSSEKDEESIAKLSDAIDAHREWLRGQNHGEAIRRRRVQYHLQSLVGRRVEELMAAGDAARYDQPLTDLFQTVVEELGSTLDSAGE